MDEEKQVEECNERDMFLGEDDEIEKEKYYGSNIALILSSRQKSTFSTKLIYVILFFCIFGSILFYMMVRTFLIKRH